MGSNPTWQDVASRLTSRVQLTTDGLRWDVDAVDRTFGINVDLSESDSI